MFLFGFLLLRKFFQIQPRCQRQIDLRTRKTRLQRGLEEIAEDVAR